MKTVIIILGVLVLVGGAYFLFLKPSQGPESSESTNTPTENTVTNTEPEDVGLLPEPMPAREGIMGNRTTLIAELVDVSGGSSTGRGFILRKDGMLQHYVMAELPEPAGNNKYEGWLVKQEPELTFFSTGVMELLATGTYELSYQGDELNEGYNFVVITEETVVDDTPETHILEGTATAIGM